MNDVRFLWSFRFKRRRAWSSSGAPALEPALELSPELVSSEWMPASKSVTKKENINYKVLSRSFLQWSHLIAAIDPQIAVVLDAVILRLCF